MIITTAPATKVIVGASPGKVVVSTPGDPIKVTAPIGLPGSPGPPGPPGEDGTSVSIVGSVPSADDLPDDLTEDDAGDGYITSDTGHLWVWDGDSWSDAGAIQGPPGPPGPPGPTTGSAYVFNQATPSATWVITHPLAYYPSVTVVDSAGSVVEGDLKYTSATSLTVSFSGAFSGTAYLS